MGVPAVAASVDPQHPVAVPQAAGAVPAPKLGAAIASEEVTVEAVVTPSSKCDCWVMVVAVVPKGITPLACPDTVPDPLPPPPARAEAVDKLMEATTVPLVNAETRMRMPVNPETFACQVPTPVADVTVVVELLGVTLNATQVVPPSPVASNCSVAENVPDKVNVAPPSVFVT